MKKLVILFSIVLLFCSLSAQDYIYKNDGGEIKAKVIEITTDVIKYKKYDFLDGPLYNINIDDVFMIVYENGQREVLKKKTGDVNTEKSIVDTPVVATDVDKPNEIISEHEAPTKKPVPKNSNKFSPNIQFGVTAGLNLSSAYYNYKDKDAQPSSKTLFGFMGGGTVNFHVAKKFAIQTGFYYMGKGDKLNLEKSYEKVLNEQYPGQDTKITGSFKSVLGYLQIPVSFNLAIPIRGEETYVLIGPGAYFAYGIWGKEKPDFSISVERNGVWTKVYENHEISHVRFVSIVPSNTAANTVYVKGIDFGAIFNLAIKGERLMISSITSIGLVNSRPDKEKSSYDPGDEKVKTLCGTIALTYFFN